MRNCTFACGKINVVPMEETHNRNIISSNVLLAEKKGKAGANKSGPRFWHSGPRFSQRPDCTFSQPTAHFIVWLRHVTKDPSVRYRYESDRRSNRDHRTKSPAQKKRWFLRFRRTSSHCCWSVSSCSGNAPLRQTIGFSFLEPSPVCVSEWSQLIDAHPAKSFSK